MFAKMISMGSCYWQSHICSPNTLWFQMTKTRQKQVNLMSRFFKQISADLLKSTSVTGDCMRFALKICQNVACTSMIRQFHELLNLIFGGFLSFDSSVQQHTAESDCCQIIVQIRNSHINQQENERRGFFLFLLFSTHFWFQIAAPLVHLKWKKKS